LKLAQHPKSTAVGACLIVALALALTMGIGGSSGLHSPASAARPSGSASLAGVHPFNSVVSASLTISPTTIQKGNSIFVNTSASGGTSPYSYLYYGLPSGCSGFTVASFTCSPQSTGTFYVQVNATDSHGNYTISNSVKLSVTSSSSTGGTGNNSSTNPFSGLLSGFQGFLQLLIIFGFIGFVTWVLLVVGVWIIAIVLLRRLPKRGTPGAASAMTKCAACSSSIPEGSKFCPNCGASTAPKSA
jgi:hypothetical protein